MTGGGLGAPAWPFSTHRDRSSQARSDPDVTGARTLAGWLGRRPVIVAAGVYAVSAAGFWLLVASGTHFLDLQVYRIGGQAVLHGTPLYSLRVFGLLFTYPPFAAGLFAILPPLPFTLAAGPFPPA